MLRAHTAAKFLDLIYYASVFDSSIDFPASNFMHDTITTTNIFRNVQCLIKVQFHILQVKFQDINMIFVTGQSAKINQQPQ